METSLPSFVLLGNETRSAAWPSTQRAMACFRILQDDAKILELLNSLHVLSLLPVSCRVLQLSNVTHLQVADLMWSTPHEGIAMQPRVHKPSYLCAASTDVQSGCCASRWEGSLMSHHILTHATTIINLATVENLVSPVFEGRRMMRSQRFRFPGSPINTTATAMAWSLPDIRQLPPCRASPLASRDIFKWKASLYEHNHNGGGVVSFHVAENSQHGDSSVEVNPCVAQHVVGVGSSVLYCIAQHGGSWRGGQHNDGGHDDSPDGRRGFSWIAVC